MSPFSLKDKNLSNYSQEKRWVSNHEAVFSGFMFYQLKHINFFRKEKDEVEVLFNKLCWLILDIGIHFIRYVHLFNIRWKGKLCSKLEWAVILWTVQQQFHGIKAASLFWGRHSSFVHETMVSLAITCVSPTFLSINANNSDLCQVENWFKNYQFRNSVEPCIQFL